MGKLKPIGSEKLNGMEKINRMLEIARYKENIPSNINENKSVEYSRTLPNGSRYQIVKEKNGYIIKKSLNESSSEYDYLDPMKNRKYYNSYSQAFKRLNLILKEINSSIGITENISLFEAADEATKYILKMDEVEEQENPEQLPVPSEPAAAAPATQAAPQAAPAPTAAAETPQEPVGDEMPISPDAEVPSEYSEPQPEEDDSEKETPNGDQPVTFKTIQKLTGKLSQKIREFSSDEDNQMSSKDIKYVINSILSALNLENLEDSDKEEIVGKFEGEEDSENMSSDDVDSEEMPDEETQEVTPEAPEAPQTGEMDESFDDMISDYVVNRAKENIKKDYPKFSEFVGFNDDGEIEEDKYTKKAKEMFEDIFSESKVENVLRKYFTLDESEKKKSISSEIRKNSENIVQEVKAKKIIEKYPSAKLLGKNKKNVLIFEINGSKLGVTKSGKVI